MGKTKTKMCLKCGIESAVIRFCNGCAQEISRNQDRDRMMERAAAAKAYLNSQRNPSRKLEVVSFLAVIHPEMPMDRIMEIGRAVEEK